MRATVTRPVRPAVYTVPEVARILRVSRGVIYRAVEDGAIPVFDFGPNRRPLRISARWLDEQLAPDFERYPPLRAGPNAEARQGGELDSQIQGVVEFDRGADTESTPSSVMSEAEDAKMDA